MTTFESQRARSEARDAVSTDRVPSAEHETALQKYLATSAYLSTSAVVHHPGPIPAQGSVVGAGRAAGSPVVVGIDGSACARGAAHWAAAEAERRGAGLHLVTAYVLPPAGYSIYNPYPPNLLGELREQGRCLLADTVAEVRRHHPALTVTTRMAYGDPKRVLAKESAGAAVTVVGAHGRNRVATALGSVAAKLAHANPAPVAVIHPGRQPGSGPVVLGVDGTTCDEAIDFAFVAAGLRATTLIALHCSTDEGTDGLVQDAATSGALPAASDEAEWLTAKITGWTTRYPDVTVERLTTDGPAAAALLEQAATAQLLVIGHRGHGGLAGLVVGSTGQAMITRSTAPVVIVPSATHH